MKSLFLGVALGAAALSAFPSAASAQVSVSVGQPGFYGRLDVGNFAPAPVLYGPRPVVIASGPVYGAAPIYLRVPRYQRLNWGRYCGAYGACGLPVLFVRDEWYTRTYVPAYRAYYGPRPYGYGYGRVDHGYHGRPGWDHGRPGGWDHGHGGGYGGHGPGFGGHGGGSGQGFHGGPGGGHGGEHGGGGHGGEHGHR